MSRRAALRLSALAVVASLSAVRSSRAATVGDVFYIDMENHNLTQPTAYNASATTSSPNAVKNNPAMPYLNSLMTPGNANASNTSWVSNYHNAGTGIHPSEPNYIWQEGGSNFGVASDNDPYTGSNVSSNPNLSALLQNAGISWKSYQEDIDLSPSSGSVNQPGTNALTSTVASQSQWTVPLKSFSGTSSSYTNPYNGSHQYGYAPKHDGQLFYTATNGGDNLTTTNPQISHYAPLQQLATDLNNSTVARYNLITPDLYDDGHNALSTSFTYAGQTWAASSDNAALAQADNFLSIIVPRIEASQAFRNNGAIVIWWDETEGGDTSSYTLPDIVISPLAKGNAYDSTLSYTHSSDLKTMQEIFQLPNAASPTGYLGDAATPGTNALSDLFKPGAIPSAVPEPAGLLGIGALTLLARRRRVRRKGA